MAHQFYGPPQDPIGLYTAPADSSEYGATPVLRSQNVQLQLSGPSIKEESSDLQHNDGPVDGLATSRPNKRQKTVEGGNNHKFVAQKKWKFQDSQRWLPSKVSSKAQNASKAITKGKPEPMSPMRPLSPAALHQVHTTEAFLNQDQPPLFEEDLGQYPTIERGPSTAGDNLDYSYSPVASDVPSRQQRPSSTSSLPLRATRSTDEISPGANLSQQGNTTNVTAPSLMVETVTRSTRAPLSKVKSSRKSPPLSFEKDKERIAAIMAEKRRVNESNLSRLRLLQRQKEHKTHRDTSIEIEEHSPARLASATRSPSETRQPSRDPDARSPEAVYNISSSPEIIRPSRSPTKLAPPSVAKLTTHFLNPRHKAGGDSKVSKENVESEVGTVESSNFPRASVSQSNPRQASKDGHEILFGTTSRPKLQGRTQRPQPTHTPGSNIGSHTPRNGSAPFEVEDADLAAQFTAFTKQLVPNKPTRNEGAGRAQPYQNFAPHYYEGQAAARLPLLQSQRVPITGSQTSHAHFRPVDRALNSGPSPTSSSFTHPPAAISLQQFPHIDLASSQANQPPIMYGTAPIRGQSASTGHALANTGYYGMNPHTWSPQHQYVHNGGMPIQGTTPFQSSTGNVGRGEMSPAAVARQSQPHPLPPKAPSFKTNMFNGNVKNPVDNDDTAAPPKPRVNMFGNTKGVPFPVDEVIRQIEMT